MQSFGWTEEHSQALREYLAKSLSFSEIAKAINARFSTDYSRSATIGRARRMGFSAPAGLARPVRAKPESKGGPVRLQKRRARILADLWPKPPLGKRAAALKLRCVGIVPRHLSLIELEAGDCRYPYGGDVEGEAITFCGHSRREGSSYCVSHFHLTRDHGAVSERSAGQARLRVAGGGMKPKVSGLRLRFKQLTPKSPPDERLKQHRANKV